MGVSTIAVFLATGVSAFFLFQTDETIKKQVEAAGIQLRAYMNFSQILYAAHFSKDPNQKDAPEPGANVGVMWKNFGATPARQATYWLSVKWYQNGAEPDFTKPESIMSDHPQTTFGPGTELPSVLVFIPLADIQKITVNSGRIFMWGNIDYRDYIPDSPVRHFHFCMYAVTLPAAGVATFNVYKAECNYAD